MERKNYQDGWFVTIDDRPCPLLSVVTVEVPTGAANYITYWDVAGVKTLRVGVGMPMPQIVFVESRELYTREFFVIVGSMWVHFGGSQYWVAEIHDDGLCFGVQQQRYTWKELADEAFSWSSSARGTRYHFYRVKGRSVRVDAQKTPVVDDDDDDIVS